jgi:transcriptional regulator with XRE-family HTH domain
MITKHTVDVDRAVGVQLQNLRLFRNLTRHQAASLLKLDLTHLAAIEEGDVRPCPATLINIARSYDIPPSRIFSVAMHSPDIDSSL